VYCQLETLRHCLPPSIRGLLDELPETLDETYERILRDIHKVNREHAHRLLQCLAAAVRPLRVEELAEVLAIDFDAIHRGAIPRLNPDWRSTDQHHAILSTCSSLIAVIDNGCSLLVQFSHFSVKEFLTSNRLAHSSGDISHYHIVLEPAHTIFAQASLAVLLSLDDRVNGSNVREVPLAEYAARYWVDHARFGNTASHIQDTMESFFDADKPHWVAWLRVHNIDEFWARFTPEHSIAAQPLYYAALCGFYNLAKKLITKYPEQVNTRGGEKVAPLVAALYGDHRQVSELLHQHGADIHVRGHWNRTLLHAAVLEGLLDVARWLLDHGADVDARQDGLWTPLHLAIYRGCFEAAKVLVEHNADVNGSSESGEVPLHLAASPSKNHDQLRVMKLLLDYGADPNARDNEGSTPLHHSSYTRGQEPILLIPERVECARLLLEHGANINAQNNKGQTPLRVALARGQHQVAEFLLGHDTN
jgi:ankyrin repeat protein